MSAEVGHLTDVKHTDDDLCFICIDNGAVRRVYSPSKPFYKRLGVMLLGAVIGGVIGFIFAVQLILMVWG